MANAIFPTNFPLKSTPAVSGDMFIISDSTAGNAVKKIDASTFIGATGATGPQGAPGAQGAPGGNNSNLPPTGSTVTTDSSTYSRITLASGAYTEYSTTGIRNYDAAGNLLATILGTGVYAAGTFTYSTLGTSIVATTGVVSVTQGYAYVAAPNTFSAPQVFQNTVSFLGLALFPYYVNTTNTSTFNATNGAKQKFVFNDSGSHTLVFQNLKAGGNYVFAIEVTGGTATLVKATTFTNCAPITTMYTIGSTTYPLSLPVGVHIFVCEAFSTAIHIAHTTSVAA